MMNTSLPSLRPAFLIGFLITACLMAVALFMQYQLEMEPCPLCILQRICVIGLGVIFLVGLLHNPQNWARRFYAGLLTLVSATGIGLALRHIWLQYLPKDKVPECGAGLDFWLETLPADQVLLKMLQGTGDCAKVSFEFLSLSIPEWMLIIFVLFFIYSLKVLIKNR